MDQALKDDADTRTKSRTTTGDFLRDLLKGDGLRARALRGTALTFFGFGAQQFLRLLSNLVLTRLLFPEAFGLMALVMVVLTGLQMISDAGISTSIVQSRRGDDPDFLNMAWTLQIGRGVLLCMLVLALARPMAQFYDQPDLAALLSVAGFNMIIQGLQSVRLSTATRHIALGRLTALELSSQAAGIVVMVLLAWWLQSVWALVIGTLFGSGLKALLSHRMLHGQRDRVVWEPEAFREILNFGKYIFVGSLAGFLINHADRAVLGKFITIGELGVYNIGFFMASVPLMVSFKLGARVLTPVYVKTPPRAGPGNRRKVRLARLMLSSVLVGLGLLLALIGDWLVTLLYEPDYALAGPIMVLLSLTYLPVLVFNAYANLLLASGKSREFTFYVVVLGALQLALQILLIREYGILGATIAPGLAALLIYPLIAWLAHRENGWDPVLDLGFLLVILIGCAGVLFLHDTAITEVLHGLDG